MAVSQLGFHDKPVNNFIDDLNGAITDSATTITLTDATGLPTQGYFRLQICSEIIRCSGRSGNDVTAVERGAEGTTAAAHSDAAEVKAVWTAEAFQDYLLSHRGTAYSDETTGQGPSIPLNRILNASNATTTVSGFTWINQGSATATDVNGAIALTIPDEANNNLRGLVLTAPSTPWRATARFRMMAPGEPLGSNSTHFGLWCRESSTSKLITQSVRYGQAQAMWRWTNATTFSAVMDTNMSIHEQEWFYIRLEDDGTNLKGFYSTDGVNWSQDGSAWWQEGRTAFMSGGPNQVGFYLNSGTNSGSSGAGPGTCTVVVEGFFLEDQ